MSNFTSPQIIIIGAGIGGLTAAALLAKAGYRVVVLEAQTYAGGCAGTFVHQGYRFDAGATIVGGFHANGPHALVGRLLDLEWPVRPHDPAWVVHLPDREIALTQDNGDVVAQFPHTTRFWRAQSHLADLGWRMSAAGMPWPPGDLTEVAQLVRVGLSHFPADVAMVPHAFGTVADWLRQMRLDTDRTFRRFLDAQLLISAQATSAQVNTLWGATALDLARQGVYHVEGGIGSLAETLIHKIRALGGEVHFRQRVTGIAVEQGRVTGVHVGLGKHTTKTEFVPADFVIANLTPFSL
ncbi:MAG: FAD-dependent oxidoreductase, partial [Anaerolineae bacterium]|nr:FAD-dependent oxidoreductase [Anaerolineae bacterium]